MVRRHALCASLLAGTLGACNAISGASDLGVCEGASCEIDVPDAHESIVLPPPVPPGTTEGGTDATTDSPAPGDAKVDVESGPDAPLGIGCQGALACERVVFVTSATSNGTLGGIAGADAKCQAAANASPLTRIKGHTFKAWVSTTISSVSSRFPHGTQAYVTVTNNVIASDWTSLTNGAISTGINIDEFGGARGDHTWTGTISNGASFAGVACSDWTDNANGNVGEQGNVGGSGGGWSGGGTDSCDTPNRLYCFEY